MAILRIKDDKGNLFDIAALRGEKGDKGDKGEDGILPVVDQTYQPESENPQSGKAVAQAIASIPAGGTWEKIVNITTTEEVNGIFATAEEFPDIAKCKEFIVRVLFPKTATALTLGAMRIVINNSHYIFRANNVTTGTVGLSETRCYTVLADGLIHTVGTENNRAHNAMVGNALIFVDDLSFSNALQEVLAALNDNTKLFPIGTRFEIYGKVEG
ncbi:MAG: hypothetical protein J6Q42_02495 [Clostridia bacterium]|jgi:hypothetical protein|nr:hypothetical protein [Clostridia bacterium]